MRDLTIGEIAHVYHEANRALQAIQGYPISRSWDYLDQETRAIVVAGVARVLDGNKPDDALFGAIVEALAGERPATLP